MVEYKPQQLVVIHLLLMVYQPTFSGPTPNDPTEPTQIFYGDRVDPAYPGQYCLRILDRNSHILLFL